MKYLIYFILIVVAFYIIKDNLALLTLLGIVVLIVYLVFFKKNTEGKNKKMEYDPNDDFIEMYQLLGFKDDITKNLSYPYFKEVREKFINDKEHKIYRFFLNNNRIERFKKGKEIIEQVLQENVINIERDENNFKIINIETSEEKPEIPFENEFLQIGLKTRGINGTVPILKNYEEKVNLINKGYVIYEFETLLNKNEFLSRKEELTKFLCTDNESILRIESKGSIISIYIGKQERVKIEWKEEYNNKWDTKFCIGYNNILTKPYYFDIDDKHILLAGGSGSGKSTVLRLLTWLVHLKDYKVYLSDFKDGSEFNSLCKRIGSITTTREGFLRVLKELDNEATKRNKLFSNASVENIQQYNKIADVKLKRIAFVVDELASPLDKKGTDKETSKMISEMEGLLAELSRKARSAGIHMILAMQRPDAKILEGQIKNNLMIRICGRFVDPEPSQIVLNNKMALDLPVDSQDRVINGRMIVKDGGFEEIQTFYFELNKKLKELREVEETKEIENFENQEEETQKEVKEVKENKENEYQTSNLDTDFSDIEF